MTLRRIMLLALLLLAPAASAHAEAFTVQGGISDNYKASYNADPNALELRTWLSMDRIGAGGTTWAPSSPGAISFASPLAVVAADGRAGQLTVSSMSSNIASVFLRTDPPKDAFGVRWGPFVTMRSAMSSSNPKARLGLTLTSGGATIATGVLDYWTSTFTAPGSSIELNGPRGRWRVTGFPLGTDWEPRTASFATALTAVVPLPPRATGVTASRRASTVRVRATARATQGARVLLSRYRIGSGGAYSAWKSASALHALRLAPGSKARVTVQVRDVRGFASQPLVRIVG